MFDWTSVGMNGGAVVQVLPATILSKVLPPPPPFGTLLLLFLHNDLIDGLAVDNVACFSKFISLSPRSVDFASIAQPLYEPRED